MNGKEVSCRIIILGFVADLYILLISLIHV